VTAVRLSRTIVEAIVRHARRERPDEACGLIVGSALAADGGLARRYVACRNAAASQTRYAVDRDDLLRVLAELDRTGEELWGIVHSHVRTAAVPSATDVGEAAWPAAVHVVVSLARDDARPSLRAWTIANGVAAELVLEIDDEVSEGAA
jgi:proteasome lid subunit RPN8/RPN11